MGDGFSTERTCAACGKTVDWRKFYLEEGICRKCKRRGIEQKPVYKSTKTFEQRWDDLMAGIAEDMARAESQADLE